MVKEVPHYNVGYYSLASDFAFATYKSGKSMAFLSPVKIGEYWSSGLPVLLTYGVGDESKIIEKGLGGVLFEPEKMNKTELSNKLELLLQMSNDSVIRKKISEEGSKLRSVDKLKLAYSYFLKEC
jgi:glycosyltransferase involved in cell wall biosynthesis